MVYEIITVSFLACIEFDSICQEVESKYPKYEIKCLSRQKKEKKRIRG
jgi:hypothetical protein